MAVRIPRAPDVQQAKPLKWWEKGFAMLPAAATTGIGTAAGTALGGPVGGILGGAVASPFGAGLSAEAERGLTEQETVPGQPADSQAYINSERARRKQRMAELSQRWA